VFVQRVDVFEERLLAGDDDVVDGRDVSLVVSAKIYSQMCGCLNSRSVLVQATTT